MEERSKPEAQVPKSSRDKTQEEGESMIIPDAASLQVVKQANTMDGRGPQGDRDVQVPSPSDAPASPSEPKKDKVLLLSKISKNVTPFEANNVQKLDLVKVKTDMLHGINYTPNTMYSRDSA